MKPILLLIFLTGLALSSLAQVDTLKEYQLEGVSIFDASRPDTVWSSEQRHVDDFVFMGHLLVLLTAREEQRWKSQSAAKVRLVNDAELVVIDSTGTERSFPLEGHSFELRVFNDTLLAILSTAQVQWIHGCSLQTLCSEFMSRKEFDDRWSHILLWRKPHMFLTDYSDQFPIAHYYTQWNLDEVQLSPKELYTAKDEWTHEVMRSEFKYLSGPDKVVAYQYELDYGVDKEYVAAYMRGFTQSNYFRPLPVKCLNTGNGMALLDQHAKRLVTWNYRGEEQTNVAWTPVSLRSSTKAPELVVDEVTHQLYLVQKAYPRTSIYALDVQTGTSVLLCQLFFGGIEKVTVHNGACFYTYRPFGASQKKYLYSERLPEVP